MIQQTYSKTAVLGLMSGTSCDGLDLALCEFENKDNAYSFRILKAQTVEYNDDWKQRLSAVKEATAQQYFELNARYGQFVAEQVNHFLGADAVKPAAIASHGHTVFHQPQRGFSTQIGCGATIAAGTGITAICDFRSLDVANGGQGAPLVPIGDQLLFGQYDACLNIGGIANVSMDDEKGQRIAYDICEANMLLNLLAEKTGQAFDRGGQMAKTGTVNASLLKQLNDLPYYRQTGAKSIGREWFEAEVLPLIEKSNLSINDLMATSAEHIAQCIASTLTKRKVKNVLITGGGAYNTFLTERIKANAIAEIILPDDTIINFKEALIFALLGYLRLRQQINTLSSVTGARSNSCGGAVYTV